MRRTWHIHSISDGTWYIDGSEQDCPLGHIAMMCGNPVNPMTQAHARLIAAAPDLLAALQACVLRFAQSTNCICDWSQDSRSFHESHCPEYTIANARTAIAKAD